MCHVLSIVVLLLRLRVTKNAIGISVKTQELYLLVFITRYLDLFTTYYSLYNSAMKVIYVSSTALIVYTIRYTEPFKSNYDASQDSFLHWKFAVAPAAVLALITNIYQGFDFIEVRAYMQLVLPQLDNVRANQSLYSLQLFWVFSIYLEAVAIIPQLIILQRYREVENLTAHYVFLLGIYRALYIVNWVYRSYHEVYYKHNWVVYICGFIQTCLYVDFFYYYFLR
jgi:ER lumen protein retaining receptor